MVTNPDNPQYWEGRVLDWTLHAQEAAKARRIPVMRILVPHRIKLADTGPSPFGGYTYTFRVDLDNDSFHIVLSSSARVVTVFRPQHNDSKHYDAMTSRSRKGVRT